MKTIHLVRQHDEKDCGVACTAMVFGYHGKKLPMATLREAIQVDQYGASIYGMIDGAARYGLTAQAYGGTAEDVWNAIQDGSAVMPAVVRILNHGVYEHYVVVNGIHGGNLLVYDPDMGKRKLAKDEFAKDFLGQIILYEKTPDFQPENRLKGQFKQFTDMVLRQKSLLVSIALMSLGVTAVGLMGTFLFQYLIDHAVTDAEGLDSFAVLLTALAGLYLVKLGVQMLRGKLLTTMSKRIDLPLMLGYYDHVTKLPMRFFDTRKTGEIMSRFQDAGKIRDAISGTALTLMIDTVMVTAAGVVLYRASAQVFLLAILTFLLYLLLSVAYIKPLDRFNNDMMEQNAQFTSYLKESLDGMETVKTAKAEQTIRDRASQLFNTLVNRNISGSMMTLSKQSLIECITSLSTLVLLWMGAVNIVNGTMTVGSLVTCATLLDYFLSPVQHLVDLQGNLQISVTAAQRLNDVMLLQTEKGGDVIPSNHIQEIAFEGVNFRYGNREQILNNLSFRVKAGEHIALVGESGCGKSTISKLVQGLYFPESGQVMVNGVPTTQLSLDWLRSQTATVPQNTFLFSDTVYNNLTLGLDEANLPTEAEMTKVLDACCCQFVKEMPLGLDSMLNESGGLSGGQRQRLALARALLRKPKLLVLDEATSALDTVTEAHILKALQEQFPDMTVLMIAHRLSTVRHCDQILVIEKGSIVEDGTHTQLLELNHRYSNLWNQQNGLVA